MAPTARTHEQDLGQRAAQVRHAVDVQRQRFIPSVGDKCIEQCEFLQHSRREQQHQAAAAITSFSECGKFVTDGTYEFTWRYKYMAALKISGLAAKAPLFTMH